MPTDAKFTYTEARSYRGDSRNENSRERVRSFACPSVDERERSYTVSRLASLCRISILSVGLFKTSPAIPVKRDRERERERERKIREITRGLTQIKDRRGQARQGPTVNLGRRECSFDPLSLIRLGLDKRDKWCILRSLLSGLLLIVLLSRFLKKDLGRSTSDIANSSNYVYCFGKGL